MRKNYFLSGNSKSGKLLLVLSFALLFTGLFKPVQAQDTLRVATYNLLVYGGGFSGCTAVSPTNKNVYLKEIMEDMRPDILGVNELGDNSLYAESILQNVMKKFNPYFERTAYTNNAQSSIVNGMFYNGLKLGLVSEVAVNHYLRDINVYKFYFKDVNLASTQDTIFLTVVQMHYKAGGNSSDVNVRSEQADAIMNYLGNIGDPGNLIIMGDLNLDNSSEPGYQKLVDPNIVALRVNDPVNSPGIWGSSFSFRDLHTQSTRNNSLSDCGVGGGLDDRYDFVLCSDEIMNNQDKLNYVNGSYMAYGNDGNRYNDQINDNNPSNTSVSASVANALYAMSDHLPVVVDLAVQGTAPIAVDDALYANFQAELAPNPAQNRIKIRVSDLEVNQQEVSVQLLDLSGKNLKAAPIYIQNGYGETELEVSGLPAGFYLVQILVKGQQAALLKLIKE